MKQIKYLGVSKGKVDDCLSCENCGDLEKGIKAFYNSGLEHCEYCIKYDFTDVQIKKAILSKRTLSFGRREANSKKFDYMIIRLDSPTGYQNMDFYVSKDDPNFKEFHDACVEQLKFNSNEYCKGILDLRYVFKDEALSATKECSGNYLCETGYLSSANLVIKIIHPKDIIIDKKKRETYNIKEWKTFMDVVGKDFAWYCNKIQCFEIVLIKK